MNAEQLEKMRELADAHAAADEYIAGSYQWEDGTGCAIGCTIRDAITLGILPVDTPPNDHHKLAAATGVPLKVWRWCDHIFEGLPPDEWPDWTPRFLRAIRPDADYSDLDGRLSELWIGVRSAFDARIMADILCEELARIPDPIAQRNAEDAEGARMACNDPDGLG